MTAEYIDSLSIEEIEELANNLNQKELATWSNNGYDGETYVKLMADRRK